MMKIVTPQEFFHAFQEIVDRERDGIMSYWENTPEYTKFILNVVVVGIGARLRLQAYPHDYYTLDAILYEEKDTEHFAEKYNYAKYISVAIEHENDVGSSCEEMNKLQLFSAPLKVLVTYARSGGDSEVMLRKYTRVIQGADCFGDIATLRRQLVIFGDKVDGRIVWEAYAYERSGFVRVLSS